MSTNNSNSDGAPYQDAIELRLTRMEKMLEALCKHAGITMEENNEIIPSVLKSTSLNADQRAYKLMKILKRPGLFGVFKSVSGNAAPRIYAYEDNSYLWYDKRGQLFAGWKMHDMKTWMEHHPDLNLVLSVAQRVKEQLKLK